MKKELMQILVCPVCKGDLSLTIEEEKEEVIRGSLYCPACQHYYPITNGIPNLLPPDMNRQNQG
jgi:uncharacterized protein